MSISWRQETGGESTSTPSLPPINISITIVEPPPPNTTVTGPATVTQTIRPTQTLTAVVPQTPRSSSPGALASESALVEANATLARNGLLISSVFGGVTILLLTAMALFLCLSHRRRKPHRENEDHSASVALAPRPRSGPEAATTQSALQPRRDESVGGPSSSSGLRSSRYVSTVQQTDNRIWPLLAQTGQPSVGPGPSEPGVPAIQIQPNTPSVIGRDAREEDQPVLPILQPGAEHMPIYEDPAAEAGITAREREAGRLGLPVVERSRRTSMSSAGADLGFRHDGERNGLGETGGHSTRASSGVFPEEDRE